MEDLLYPDNSKREKRVNQLTDDIAFLVNELKNDASEIKTLLKELDQVIREMYAGIQVPIPSSATRKVDYQGWVVDVIEGIAPFIVLPIVSAALEAAAVSFLLGEGLIGEAALVGLVGLPVWLSLGVASGAIIIVIGVELLIAGIAGAEKRDKLRDAIHSAIQPRINLKKASLINDELKEKLQAVRDSCTLMIELGYTREQVDGVQKSISEEFKSKVDKISDEVAKKDLEDLDHERGSWTNEDY